MSKSSGSSFQIDSEASKYITVAQVYNNTGQKLIVITEDKLKLCLIGHIEKMNRKTAWQTPLGIFLAIVTAYSTSTFHDYLGIKAAVWEACFLLAGVLALVWLVPSVKNAFISASVDDIISACKESSTPIDSLGQQSSLQPYTREMDHSKGINTVS